ncbi:hypothetical protein AcV7_006602 [Taiwanofungus camphoratus]|nr:hypothetical protein AcV7_006602 [Antrodia cinnamomea]
MFTGRRARKVHRGLKHEGDTKPGREHPGKIGGDKGKGKAKTSPDDFEPEWMFKLDEPPHPMCFAMEGRFSSPGGTIHGVTFDTVKEIDEVSSGSVEE